MTARHYTVRPGFQPTAIHQWQADAARADMALCVVIAFVIGFICTVIACL